MAHALSASYMRFERMSPPAFALAVLLHGLVALALWWLSQNRSALPAREDAIEVTIEKPRPPPPPRLAEQLPPLPTVIEGLRPPAPIVSDTPTQVPTPTRQGEPLPPQTEARVEPGPAPPPARPAEAVKPAEPPQAHGIVVPPANPLPTPSPPNRAAPQRQAAIARGSEQPAPSPFVNPADVYNRARLTDDYLWEVVRKLRGYQYRAHVTVEQGLTVVRVVIARDGRLLDAEVVRSSGVAEMDRGVLAGVRAGSPYTPLPPDMPGPSASFLLPLVSVVER